MPLFIKQKKFEEQSLISDIKEAIKTVSSPEIVPFKKNIAIKPEEAAIFLQRESAKVLVLPHDTKAAKYLATQDSLVCMTVYATNKQGEYAAIHIDGTRGSAIALNELLDSFTDKNNLEITLMGGLPDKTSEALLELIINTLIKREEKITLIAQHILERNNFTENSKQMFMRDDLLEKASILFEKLYDDAEFDFNLYATYTPDLFEKRNDDVTQDKIKNPLSLMLYIAMMMTELLPEKFYKIIQNPNHLPLLKKYVPTPEKFHALFKLVFCKNIYQWVLGKLSLNTSYFNNKSALPNFAFNLKTGHIHEISAHMPTTYSTERMICYHEQPSNNKQHNYFLCYRDNAYVKPNFSESSRALASKYSKYVVLPYIPDAEFGPLISVYDHEFFKALKKWNKALKVQQQSFPNTTNASSSSKQTQSYPANSLKTLKIEELTPAAKIKYMDLILCACNGELEKLKAMFTSQKLDKEITDNIIQCVLNWSKISIAEQNTVIAFLIENGAGYIQYFLNADADFNLMKRLISCGAKININHLGYTTLHSLICRDNADEMIEFLLENDIDINMCENMYGHGTVLHILIANENLKKTLDFIRLAHQHKKTIDYSAKDKEGKTLLIIATKVMSLPIVTRIIDENKDCVDMTDNEGRTALHFACALGQTNIVDALINAGADINARDNQGNTPAHYAGLGRPVINLMLASIHIDPDRDSGAIKNAVFDKDNKAIAMPLFFLQSNKLKTTSYISCSTDKNTHGEILCSIENRNFLEKSLTYAQNEDRECLLKQISTLKGKSISEVCLAGQPLVMEKLIASGADVTLPNKEGQKASSNNPTINGLLLLTSTKIMQARPKPLDENGEPTAQIDFYDPNFAKVVRGLKLKN